MKHKSLVCKGALLYAIASFLLLAENSFGADFLRGRWDGIEVNNYDFGTSVNVIGFTTSGPDANGYVTLCAKPSEGDSQPIFRTRLAGVYLQSYTAPGSEVVNGIIATSDADSIYLSARATDNSTGEIFRAKWVGIEAQTAEASGSNVIHGFVISGPDADGYVYLGFTEGPAKVEEVQKGKFTFSVDVYSNPGNSFTIKYSVPGGEGEKKRVSLRIYDLQGREVKKLMDENLGAGNYYSEWDCTDEGGKSVGAGNYFVKFKTGKKEELNKKIVVVK